MRALALSLIALLLPSVAVAGDVLRIGGDGDYMADTSGSVWVSTGGRRAITITPTVVGRPAHRSGSYTVTCTQGFQSRSFTRRVRVPLNGVASRCKVWVQYMAWGPESTDARVVVRVVVRLT